MTRAGELGNSLLMHVAYGNGVMVECILKLEGSSSAPMSECINKHEDRDSRANSRRGVRREDRVDRRRDGYNGLGSAAR